MSDQDCNNISHWIRYWIWDTLNLRQLHCIVLRNIHSICPASLYVTFCFFPFTRTPFEHALLCCQAAHFPYLYQFLQSQRNLSTPSRSKRLSWLAGRSSWSVLQNTEGKKTLHSFQNTIDSVFPVCFLRRLLTENMTSLNISLFNVSCSSTCRLIIILIFRSHSSNQSMSKCSSKRTNISSAISNWLPH